MILNSLKKNDIPQIINYGKARGVIRLNKLLPDLTPFKEFLVVEDYKDLQLVYNFLPDNYYYRRDLPLGEEISKRVEKSGDPKDIKDYFLKMKELNPNGALLIMFSDISNNPRYSNNGAFNIAINKGESLVIEFVGKGYDGRELSHGSVCHECYIIPWNEFLFCDNASKLNKYKATTLTQEKYNEGRVVRENYLKKTGVDQKLIDEHLPKEYVPLNDYVKKQILNQIALPLFINSVENNYEHLNYSWVCGIVTNENKIMPFEFSCPERVHPSFVKDAKELTK